MLICGGVGGEPFELPMEVDGIPHMLIIGPTGVGKSTLLGAMTCGFLQEPGARVFILDVGRSSYVLARCLGADYSTSERSTASRCVHWPSSTNLTG
jgi:type IV secretory pathway VirB4 component